MCLGDTVVKTINPWLKNWSFSTIDVDGMSGGHLTGWSLDFKAVSTSSVRSSIAVKLKYKNNDFSFSVINIYGPYADRISFWEELKSVDIFSDPLCVIEGDVNFTLSLRQVWGSNPREEQQRGLFLSFIEEAKLVDIEPVKLSPTWRNYRTGRDEVAKRTDRFLVSEFFLEMGFRF